MSEGVGGNNLWLQKEPSSEEIIEELKNRDLSGYTEFVFCGFGEPLFAFDKIVEIGGFLRKAGKKVRLNTNGQADLIVGRNAAERLEDAVDTVSISLNASDAKKYNEICECAYGEDGFFSMLRFAKECVGRVKRVIFSVVNTIGEDEIKRCEKIAADIGAEFRVRKYDVYASR
jgi:TatD family-associated radical SAM protein